MSACGWAVHTGVRGGWRQGVAAGRYEGEVVGGRAPPPLQGGRVRGGVRTRRGEVRASAAGGVPDGAGMPGGNQLLVFVPPHPLVPHYLAVCRNAGTPVGLFRSAVAELGRILVYEAVRDHLPMLEVELETPLAPCPGQIVDPNLPYVLVPVLRAGLLPLERIETVVPNSVTYHVGLVRDEETLEPTEYLNKLPASIDPRLPVLVSDPMLATGGTMMRVLEMLQARGADLDKTTVVSVVAAPAALNKISKGFPGKKLRVYTACIDEHLSDKGFIIPGLGDAGDRAYGT